MIRLVTPSLAYGDADTSLFERVGDPERACNVIEEGGRALVPDVEVAREVLRLLDVSDQDALIAAALAAIPEESVFP